MSAVWRMKIDLPKGKYLKNIVINENDLDIEFAPRKKVALLFISLNEGYWPYLTQVIKDCRKNFLPQHQVDFFLWSDFSEEKEKELEKEYEKTRSTLTDSVPNDLLVQFTHLVRLYTVFYPAIVKQVVDELAQQGVMYQQKGLEYSLHSTHTPGKTDYELILAAMVKMRAYAFTDFKETLKGETLSETGSVSWPAPTLMRYHLFLQKEEELKDYDYIFYLDADMRVVDKISDEILGKGLIAAPHPGYALAPKFIPPYEPNPDSEAHIHRLGRNVEENGKQRFMPFYAAGGFQGGTAKEFILAMQTMKKRIDIDFDNNYTAIWNDESHWNKYLWDYKGDITFLDPSYVYPDSLIKEYYIPLWGRDYPPKIITLTKPFSLSAQGGQDLQSLQQMPQ